MRMIDTVISREREKIQCQKIKEQREKNIYVRSLVDGRTKEDERDTYRGTKIEGKSSTITLITEENRVSFGQRIKVNWARNLLTGS